MALWKLTEPEFFWLIGILEGEGNFRYGSTTHCVRVRMCDEDTVQRVAEIMGRLGDCHINVMYEDRRGAGNGKWNDSFVAAVHGEAARQVMKAVVKHMCWRRRQQIWQALNCRNSSSIKKPTQVINLVELVKGKSNG